MDPLSALGLTSAILQIIDYSSRLISGAAEVYSSASGTTVELEDSDRTIQSLRSLTQRLEVRTVVGPLSIQDRSLLEMKHGCEELSQDIQAVINSTKPKNKGSKRASVAASWRAMRWRGKLKTLEERLNRYRTQALEYLFATMSDDLSNTNKFLEVLTQEQAHSSQTTRSEIQQMKTEITTVIHEAQARQGTHSGGVSSDPLLFLPTIQESLAKLVKATQIVTQEDFVLQKLWFAELGGRERTVEMPHGQTFRWLLYDSEPQYSEPRHSDSQNSDWETLCSWRETTDSMRLDQYSWSEQSGGTNDDDDAMSFHTAPDGDKHGVHNALGPIRVGPRPKSSPPRHRSTARENERDSRSKKRESFLKWLRTGDGIFYCSGKAGSGKSTLMKFLALENKTKDELSLWSQTKGKTLILASFFFWTSGTPLQRSLEGLYREILWDILRKFPSLIPVVFPAALSSVGVGSPSEMPQSFTMGELESAADRLFREEAVASSHSLCLFIDGLDEYEGDCWMFSKAISRWAASSKDIKFCLSSRPHRVFLRHFALEDARHLNLHDFTRPDMYQFVSDHFRQDERYTAMEEDISQEIDLIKAVVDRSDGVFLWVRLVTAELLTGMGNDCSIRQLIKKLHTIPRGVENMFQQMLDSIDRTERKRAAEMFLTMTMNQTRFELGNRSVFIQATLDDLTDDPRLTDSLLSGKVGPYLSPGECIRKCHIAGARAIARCRGLIEVTHTSMCFPECHEFSFVHRTVGDFFQHADIQSTLRITAGDFCPYRRLCHAVLGCFKFINLNERPECPAYEPHRPRGSAAMKATVTRTRGTLNAFAASRQYHLMNTLLFTIKSAESDGISHLAVEIESMTSMLRQEAMQSRNDGSPCHFSLPFFSFETRIFGRFCRPGLTAREHLLSAVVSYSMCGVGIQETVFELASRNPGILVVSPGSHHVFLSAALSDLLDAFCLGQDARRTRILIERASSSINAECSERCSMRISYESPRTLGPQVTTWSTYLLSLSRLLRARRPRAENKLARISTQLELFLQHGADPSVIFIGYSFTAPTDDVASPQPTGPLYMDLLGMIMFWRLVLSDLTLDILNVARQRQRRGWLYRLLDGLPWVGRQAKDAYEKMTPLDENIGSYFFPLSIIPYGSLANVPWETLQETANWISEHGFSHVNLRIEV